MVLVKEWSSLWLVSQRYICLFCSLREDRNWVTVISREITSMVVVLWRWNIEGKKKISPCEFPWTKNDGYEPPKLIRVKKYFCEVLTEYIIIISATAYEIPSQHAPILFVLGHSIPPGLVVFWGLPRYYPVSGFSHRNVTPINLPDSRSKIVPA